MKKNVESNEALAIESSDKSEHSKNLPADFGPRHVDRWVFSLPANVDNDNTIHRITRQCIRPTRHSYPFKSDIELKTHCESIRYKTLYSA
jgi:hypothetical protein